MRKFVSLLGLAALLIHPSATIAEVVKFQCVGEFNFSDGEGQGFDGAYRWSFYVNLDEDAGTLVSAPMFPEPVSVDVSPDYYRAIVHGEWCFKPYGPSDENSYCADGIRTLQIDRRNLALTFSYTPKAHGQPLGALRRGNCQNISGVGE